jgi:hypothetical protein
MSLYANQIWRTWWSNLAKLFRQAPELGLSKTGAQPNIRRFLLARPGTSLPAAVD